VKLTFQGSGRDLSLSPCCRPRKPACQAPDTARRTGKPAPAKTGGSPPSNSWRTVGRSTHSPPATGRALYEVGHARSRRPDERDGTAVVNQAGSGAMFLASGSATVPLDDLAGWRFDVKPQPRAPAHFEYTIGTVDSQARTSRP